MTVSAGNQPPVVTTNVGLTVTEGGSGVISQFVLQATDPDNTPDELTFTVSAGPAHGTLLVDGTAATTFTQADINAGNVSYQNDGGESFTDAFAFTVSDGRLATGSATFTIFVTPVNDPPTLMTNAGLTVVRGSSAVIGHAALDTADPDDPSSQLTFTVTAGPAHGVLQLGGLPVADVHPGRPRRRPGPLRQRRRRGHDRHVHGHGQRRDRRGRPDGVRHHRRHGPPGHPRPGRRVGLRRHAGHVDGRRDGRPGPDRPVAGAGAGRVVRRHPRATATTYTFTPTLAADGNQYRAVFTNEAGSATSTAATLTVTPGLVVLTGPVSQVVSLGDTATFAATATGSTRPTVQWQVSTDGGLTYSIIPGATRTTLKFAKVSAAQDGALYRAVFRTPPAPPRPPRRR